MSHRNVGRSLKLCSTTAQHSSAPFYPPPITILMGQCVWWTAIWGCGLALVIIIIYCAVESIIIRIKDISLQNCFSVLPGSKGFYCEWAGLVGIITR